MTMPFAVRSRSDSRPRRPSVAVHAKSWTSSPGSKPNAPGDGHGHGDGLGHGRGHGLGRGHGMAIVHVIKKGPKIDASHVGTTGPHRDASDTLWLDGAASKPG